MMIWLSLFAASAMAYIPEYSMIASRAADQHGKGTYQIEQDVTFRRETESYSVRETWLVNGENLMAVKIEGKGPLKGLVSGTVIYDGNSRIFFDGSLRSQKLGDEWLEPFFHFRNSKFFRSKLVSLRVTPPDSLRDRAPLASEGEIKYEPPNFIRLARTGGGLSWAIGTNPISGESPTVWLEQDQFVLRKYKALNNTVLRADDYAKYDETFWYPRTRAYQFGGFNVTVQTVSVQPSGKNFKDPAFKGATLVTQKDVLRLPDVDGLRDFYQRFR
jgi:hypothetical protein